VTFDITPTNLRRAFDTGLDADTLLERQTAVIERGTELPQPLAYTVKDVARTHGRLRVSARPAASALVTDALARAVSTRRPQPIRQPRFRSLVPSLEGLRGWAEEYSRAGLKGC
jgi:hypothetical protein